jgi:hypothetical protein
MREMSKITEGLELRNPPSRKWHGICVPVEALGRNWWRRQVMTFGKKVCPICSREIKYVFSEDGRVRPLCPKCNVYLDQGNLRPVMYGYESMDEVEC